MKNSNESNQLEVKSSDTEPRYKGSWTQRIILMSILMGGGMVMGGCAATPDKPTAGEALDEEEQLAELGVNSVGLQPDGTVVQHGAGKTVEKAKEKAVKRAQVILGEGDFNFAFSKPLKRADGKWQVCVKGGEGKLDKPVKKDPIQMIKDELGAERMGLQDDGSVVQYGVGKSLAKAKRAAERRAQAILGREKATFTFSKGIRKPNKKWMVGVKGKLDKPSKKDIHAELMRDLGAEEIGEQDDGSFVEHGEGKTHEGAKAAAEGLVRSKLKGKLKFSISSRRNPDNGIWIAYVRGRTVEDEKEKDEKEEPQTGKLPDEIEPTVVESSAIPSDILGHTKYLIKKYLKSFKHCYEKELKRNPDLNIGKIEVSFFVNTRGKVSRVECTKNGEPLLNERLTNCIKKTVKNWRFEKRKEDAEVYFPLLLSPQGS